MRVVPVLGAVLFLMHPGVARGQAGHPLKVLVVYNNTDASSSAVAPLLTAKFASNPKLFTVANDQGDKDMSVLADCYRETPSDPYSCFYVTHKLLGSIEGLVGAGIVVRKSAEEAASDLFASILQDVAERWNNTDRKMLISELETCLFLTESSCAVPAPLVSELKTKSINLSQYLRSGGLK